MKNYHYCTVTSHYKQKALGLDELHMYDLYVPITGDAPIKYNYQEASLASVEALKPLGEDTMKS